jgi:hypothetical protein
MQTIETSISVNHDGLAVIELKLPQSIPAGEHRAVVIVEEQPTPIKSAEDQALDLLPLSFEGWPKDCNFRREDLYGDEGR